VKCACPSKPMPKLDKYVTVRKLRSGLTPNASGHIDETDETNWTNAGQEWAEFITQGSREFFRGEEIAADITHQVTMRWNRRAATYTTDMQLKMGGRTFHIAAPPVNIDEQDLYLRFATKEIK
jgi:SPP1 family predicted phage head-tail adaptor